MEFEDLVKATIGTVTDKQSAKILGMVGNTVGFASPEDLLDYEKIAGYVNNLRNQWAQNSFCIRFSLDDSVKVIEIGGYTDLYTAFRSWVTGAGSVPCEIKKDGTDFAYLNPANSYAARVDGSTSHVSDTTYLQMTEIANINVGFYTNGSTREMEIWFNMQSTCPDGMHPMNTGGVKKLWARYDTTFNSDGSTINSCKGTSQPSGNWSMDLLFQMNKATKSDLMEITTWEFICMAWIAVAYYKDTNIANTELGEGLVSDGESVARGFVNGSTDTLTTPNGKISSGAYRFMYLENIFSGKQWLETCGWRGENGVYYLTYSDVKANKASLMAISDADYTGSFKAGAGWYYPKNVDFFGFGYEDGGSTTTGLNDGQYTDTGGSRICLVCGDSDIGSGCGFFCRGLNLVSGSSGWSLRGRCALRR